MTKTEKIFKLMGLLIQKNEICNTTEWVLNELGDCNSRTLDRDLKELKEYFPEQIITRIDERKTYYKLVKSSDILLDFLSKTDDVSWVIGLINDTKTELSLEIEVETKKLLGKLVSSQKNIFLYHNSPFEELKDDETKQIFETIKTAIKERRYQNIEYHYNNYHKFEEVKCLKLIFMENNWYVAVATQEKKVFFLRIPFIQKIRNSSNRASYQVSPLLEYEKFLKNFQNPMTLFGIEKKRVYLLASSKIAKYFKPNMKKFLPSQTFIKENIEGTVEFSLEYTQPIEVLPFVKKWLPDLKIIAPTILEEQLIKELSSYLK